MHKPKRVVPLDYDRAVPRGRRLWLWALIGAAVLMVLLLSAMEISRRNAMSQELERMRRLQPTTSVNPGM